MAPSIPINLTRRPAQSSASTTDSTSALATRLAAVLPKAHAFHLYHISTPPTKTAALFSAPPGERDDRTYVEKHFLAVAIDVPPSPPTTSNSSSGSVSSGQNTYRNGTSVESHVGQSHLQPDVTSPSQVLVLGLEIFIYTTIHSSIYFVSKADSTGYLHLLRLPRGTPSPIREISSAFLSHLLHVHRRAGVQSIVSLFARSQAQYLFPGSIENSGKHVLDDRGLVRWWCRVLDSMLESAVTLPLTQPNSRRGEQRGEGDQLEEKKCQWATKKGYLLVPGLDRYETLAFLPKTPSSRQNWVIGHPLHQISHYMREYSSVPPRCLIPRFPDDPKSRFRDELDDETHSATGTQTTGAWKSIRDLDQFWDIMAFRQECSSGQMTGFIWVVFDPPSEQGKDEGHSRAGVTTSTSSNPTNPSRPAKPPSTPPRTTSNPIPSPLKSILGTPVKTPLPSHHPPKSHKKRTLTGPIIPRKPHIKTRKHTHLGRLPVTTSYYHWPESGRGSKLVDDRGYEGISKLLLRLDFANLEMASSSTDRWVQEVGQEEGAGWSIGVIGTRELPSSSSPSSLSRGQSGQGMNGVGLGTGQAVNNINGLVKRKRATTETEVGTANGNMNGIIDGGGGVNVLGAGLVRKKQKPET